MARLLAAVALALIVFSSLAHAQAGIPNAANSTPPLNLNLVGTSATGVPDPAGALGIVLRDAFNNVIANRAVRIDFSGCGGDVALSSNQPGATSVDCVNRMITFTTNGSGVINASILGHVQTLSPPTVTACALVQAENLPGESPAWVTLGTVSVGIYDLDGVNGVDAHDYLNFLCDLFSGQPRRRSDYNHNGNLNSVDHSLFLSRMFSEQSKRTPTRCDAQATLVPPVAASLSGFNLRWGRCPQAYSVTKNFNCDDEDLSDELTITIIAPTGLTSVAGAEIELEIQGPEGVALGDWWRFDVGGCRNGSLTAAATLTNAINCPPRVGALSASTAFVTYPHQTIDRERVRVLTSYNGSIALTAGNEYTLARILIDHQSTFDDVCVGCAGEVMVKLVSVRLLPTGCASAPLAADVLIESADYAQTAVWQGLPDPILRVVSAYPAKFVGGSEGGVVDVTVHGKLFLPGCTILLRRSGEADIPGVVQSVDPGRSSLAARFDLAGAASGGWDIVVTNPDMETGTGTSVLTVVPVIPAKLKTSIVGSSATRPSRVITQSLWTDNLGNVPFTGTGFAAFWVKAGTGPVTVFNDGSSLGTYTPVSQGARDLVGVFTVHPVSWIPGSRYDFTFDGPVTVGTTQVEAQLFQLPPTLPGPPAETEARGATTRELIRASAVAQGFTWPALSTPFLAALQTEVDQAVLTRTQSLTTTVAPDLTMSNYSHLVLTAVDDALTALAGTYPTDVNAYRSVFDPLRTVPANLATFQAQLPAVATAMVSPPKPTELYPSPLMVRPISVITSVDPNDKGGPSGPGPEHYMGELAPLGYVIHFENLPNASAAAQTVAVDDQLDGTKVDFNTLSLGRITFGDHVIDPPPGLTSFTTDVDLRPGVDLIARVTAELGSTGNLSWRFKSLDPNTLAPTNDAFLGFLPPNTSPPNGEGSVSVVVNPVSSVGDGTSLPNWARIVFDENPHIDTPVWTNTLDLSPPSSQVTSLTPTQEQATFDVAWSGSDGGSGIADYSVFVRDNGGPYTVWQDHVTTTTAQFTGEHGHVYDFYSTARDQVGQVEAAPSNPDASTEVNTTGIGDKPLPVRFAMRLAGRNPVRTSAIIELALPRAGSARIEVMDVAGRLVFSREFKELKAGYHPITLNELDRVAPGVFLVRATSGGESARTKIAVVR